jgi:hydrogenase expression/formation protein HypE
MKSILSARARLLPIFGSDPASEGNCDICWSIHLIQVARRAWERRTLADDPFLTGKVPSDLLSRIVFRYTGKTNHRLLLGPALGEDAAIIRTRGKLLVLTTDPITGAQKNAGWLSVHVNANDIATRGAKPVWFLCCLLLPEQSDAALLEQIMSQVDEAAREISVTVAGGHSEITPGLDRPIMVGSMIGETDSDKYVTTAGARPGDRIILTKTVGLEGTAILASDLEAKLVSSLGDDVVRHAKVFSRRISVVRDAMIAVKSGGVHAMHDPTEGGVICGLWELGEASGTGVIVEESKIAIAPETESVCDALGVDPLRVLSSGSLLIAARPGYANRISRSLQRGGIEASVIGEITQLEKGRIFIKRDGTKVKLEPPARDELYKVLDESRAPFR